MSTKKNDTVFSLQRKSTKRTNKLVDGKRFKVNSSHKIYFQNVAGEKRIFEHFLWGDEHCMY